MDHIDEKAMNKFDIIQSFTLKLDMKALDRLYLSFALSIQEYGDMVWSDGCDRDLDKPSSPYRNCVLYLYWRNINIIIT